MKTTEELARQTLKEKWYRNSEARLFDRCCFCKDAVGSRMQLNCNSCKIPGGFNYVCRDIEKMVTPSIGRVRDLTEEQFQFVKEKIEALIPFGAK